MIIRMKRIEALRMLDTEQLAEYLMNNALYDGASGERCRICQNEHNGHCLWEDKDYEGDCPFPENKDGIDSELADLRWWLERDVMVVQCPCCGNVMKIFDCTETEAAETTERELQEKIEAGIEAVTEDSCRKTSSVTEGAVPHSKEGKDCGSSVAPQESERAIDNRPYGTDVSLEEDEEIYTPIFRGTKGAKVLDEINATEKSDVDIAVDCIKEGEQDGKG